MQENTPSKAGLLELLRNCQGTQFVIPAYQRNYTWTAKNEVKQLLDDIKAVLREERTKHFIGIMIYLNTHVSTFESERSVIDGQQRLTTIFLILYSIKAILKENGRENDADRLEQMYLVNPLSENYKYKLKPLVSDDTVYQHIVNDEFDSIENVKSNIYLNYVYIKTAIEGMLANFTIDKVMEALDKLYLVCVPIGKDDYPQKIFESINATGAKLTASDLIRNFLLMPIKSEQQDAYYSKYWKKLEALIDTDSKKLEAFFRFFLMAKRLTLINKNNVYRAFTEWYQDNFDVDDRESVFKMLVDYAGYYNAIYKAPIANLGKEIRKPLAEFRNILSDMPAPLLMEFYSLHKTVDGKNKPLVNGSQFGEIVSIINSYLMRRALCGMDTSDISRYFPTLLKETLADCNGDYGNIVELFKKNLVTRNKGNSQEMPDDARLHERITNANMYNLRLWLNIFFQKYESENNPAPVDFSHLSIEHIMPQTGTPQWFADLDVDNNTYDAYVHRLGNLTFASKIDNSKMGNKDWQSKKKLLESTGHLKINMPLLQKEAWTLDEIDARTDQLINEIAKLYPYYEATSDVVAKINIDLTHKGMKARGYYYPDNGCVEILAGSQLYTPDNGTDSYQAIDELRQELIDAEIIVEKNGNLVFASDYLITPKRANATALSPAVDLLLRGSHNGWEWWTTEDGSLIKDIRNNDDEGDNTMNHG